MDEVSNVHPDLLLLMDHRLQQTHGDTQPFGGIHSILTGDLYQLPPVRGSLICEAIQTRLLWQQFTKVELTTNMRQCKDLLFHTMLKEIRAGNQSQQTRSLMECQVLQKKEFDEMLKLDPVKSGITDLAYRNKDVEYINQQVMEKPKQRNNYA